MTAGIDDGYMVVLRVRGRRVLVVGGGKVAARKVRGLVAAGAAVVVVAPEVDAEIEAQPGVTVRRRPYEPSDLDGVRLVIVATDDRAVNQQVYDDAEAAGIWVNAADDPERCSFVLPAVARRGPVILAVSTQGASPALASRLRDDLAESLPADLEQVVEMLAAERAKVHARGGSTEDVDWNELLNQLLGPSG